MLGGNAWKRGEQLRPWQRAVCPKERTRSQAVLKATWHASLHAWGLSAAALGEREQQE